MRSIKEFSLISLVTYANLTDCAFEFGNGGNEVIIIPPKLERAFKRCEDDLFGDSDD